MLQQIIIRFGFSCWLVYMVWQETQMPWLTFTLGLMFIGNEILAGMLRYISKQITDVRALLKVFE